MATSTDFFDAQAVSSWALTPKALRVYETIGLLRPVEIDVTTSYRYYDTNQLSTARLIAVLRGVDMSLADISELLRHVYTDTEHASRRLDEHLEVLEGEHSSRRSLVRHIHALLREEPSLMYNIETRHVSAQRVMSIQRRLHAPETDPFVEEAKAAFKNPAQRPHTSRTIHVDLPRHRRP